MMPCAISSPARRRLVPEARFGRQGDAAAFDPHGLLHRHGVGAGVHRSPGENPHRDAGTRRRWRSARPGPAGERQGVPRRRDSRRAHGVAVDAALSKGGRSSGATRSSARTRPSDLPERHRFDAGEHRQARRRASQRRRPAGRGRSVEAVGDSGGPIVARIRSLVGSGSARAASRAVDRRSAASGPSDQARTMAARRSDPLHSRHHAARSKRLPSLRHLFEVPADVSYLDAAAWSPLPRVVRAAGEAGILIKSRPWDHPRTAFPALAERAREAAAHLIGAGADDVAIVGSVSHAMAIAAYNIRPASRRASACGWPTSSRPCVLPSTVWRSP